MDNRYNRHNRRKYNLKVPIVLVTKYRKQLLKDLSLMMLNKRFSILLILMATKLLAIETDKDHIHFLLIYDTTDRVCDIVKIVKQETTYYLCNKVWFRFCLNSIGRKKYFGQTDIFACSIGEVSSTTIQKYIENQG